MKRLMKFKDWRGLLISMLTVKKLMCPTKYAPEMWVPATFSSIFIVSIFFCTEAIIMPD
jgi:hypothetical protein